MRSNPNLPLKQVTYYLWKGLGFPCTKCWEGGGGEDSEAKDSGDAKEMAGREKGKGHRAVFGNSYSVRIKGSHESK